MYKYMCVNSLNSWRTGFLVKRQVFSDWFRPYGRLQRCDFVSK